MNLTEFIFFKNTPFTDFQNTILFENNQERDDFFLKENHYKTLKLDKVKFNFIRDRQSLKLAIPYGDFMGVNYCTFISDFEPNTRYYAYVINFEYYNDQVTTVNLLIDGIMTFCQGSTINNFRNITVLRKHMNRAEYKSRLTELRNNDDVIKTYTKKYTHTDQYKFDQFDILIQSSCDFTSDFGDENNPKIKTSTGLKFDNISSPLNLYVVKQEDFPDLMSALSPFPWISQNIRSVNMIPSILLEGKTVKVNMQSGNFDKLYTLLDGQTTNKGKIDEGMLSISKTIDDLYNIFGLDKDEDKHLLRNEYTTSEVYTYDGQQLFIDNGQLSETYGLFFRSVFVSGFHNEVGIYIDNYKSTEGNDGSFLNDSIFFRNFDDVPIMIDNYTLSMAKSANQRQLAESKLITNRITNVMDSQADIQDRFFNATSLVSNVSPMNLFGKFQDEYEFYRQQQAEFKDMALSSPSITNQSNNNSLAISEGYYGLTVKHAQPNASEWKKIKTYYKLFGFQVNDEHSQIDLFTNTICNYCQIKGQIIIPDIDVSILESIKAQLENGVRFWHNNHTPNPMTQDILDNKIRG